MAPIKHRFKTTPPSHFVQPLSIYQKNNKTNSRKDITSQHVVFNKNDHHDCTSIGSSAEVDDGELPAVFLSSVFSKAVLDVSCW